jgi:putative RNA 2'-phosphotransferase
MLTKRHILISKYLSKHLRHKPQEIGISIGKGGWVEVSTLLEVCAKNNFTITTEELIEVVENNDKQRFSFNNKMTLIRANQGHSIEIDLELISLEPPDILYHGTAAQFLPMISNQGLRKMNRHHVHLSMDLAVAKNVGQRHGKPVVLAIDSQSMFKDGHQFFRSENGVWLVDHVPPQYLGFHLTGEKPYPEPLK